MSPIEAFRTQAFALLADPDTGINPQFTTQCSDRNIVYSVPAWGGKDGAPFDFSANSANVFTLKAPQAWIDYQIELQYPNLNIYGVSVTQTTDSSRLLGVVSDAETTLEIRSYLGWLVSDKPNNDVYERTLDALEEAFFNVLNADQTAYLNNVLYPNRLAVRERMPLMLAHNDTVLRNGLVLNMSARCISQ